MTKKCVMLAVVSCVVVLVGTVGLSYADPRELADIRTALHQHGRRWVAGETEISILPSHQRTMRTRLIKPQATGREQVIGQGTAHTSVLKATLDWRNNGVNGGTQINYVTPVRDQGNCGSCWAFATTAALESFLLISQPSAFSQTTLDLAEQILVSCSGAGNCNGGYIDKASNYVRNTGLPPEGYDPYTATNGTCPPLSSWQGATDKSQGWGWVTTTSVKADALKNALNTYGPLITTMEVYSDFFYYSSGVYQHTSGSVQGGHAILIVGYVDDATTPAWGGGYFIVKNSWGTSWGEAGFFNIAYSEITGNVLFGEWTIANLSAVAPSCTYAITPTSEYPPAAGGTGSVSVTTQSTCTWTVSNMNSWIHFTSNGGTGSGQVSYSVDANQGAARIGTATIAGKTFTVNQAAANVPIISVSPTSVSFGSVRVGRTSTKNVTISNKGAASLTTSISITGGADFSQSNGCGSVAANGSCTVQVTFKPLTRNSESASLTISSNDPVHGTVSAPLSGAGY